jgi:hypothetical protein
MYPLTPIGWSFTKPRGAFRTGRGPARGLRPLLASRSHSGVPPGHPVDARPARAAAPPLPAYADQQCQPLAGSSPAARFGRSVQRARSKAQQAHLLERVRHSETRAAHGRRAEVAARDRHRPASPRPLGGDCVHVGHHLTALRAVGGIVCESCNLRGKPRPFPVTLGRLCYRLASCLCAGEPPLACDVLQGMPTIGPKTKGEWMGGGSHQGSVARSALHTNGET